MTEKGEIAFLNALLFCGTISHSNVFIRFPLNITLPNVQSLHMSKDFALKRTQM